VIIGGLVEEYWSGVAKQLQVEADVFSRLVQHNAEMGRSNELALAKLATRLLPSSVDVGTGVIFDSDGNRSAQTDLIIFDRAKQPQMMAQSTQLLFPVETVLLAIEVKTTVNGAAVADLAAKVDSIRSLNSRTSTTPVPVGLFGYAAGGAPSTQAQALNALPAETRPDFACILNPGLVGGLSKEELAMGFVPLHKVNQQGRRLSREWEEAPTGHTGRDVILRGSTYPVSRSTAYGTQKLVFEPGRALLLFSLMMLEQLSNMSDLQTSWLQHYVPELAQELFKVEPAPQKQNLEPK
jgi:hypothetical protein